MELLSKRTRFRAYQLEKPGSLYSYFADNEFTLIEAVLSDITIKSINEELKICNVATMNDLQITSWDRDHCCPTDLELILKYLRPIYIDIPAYLPDSDSGKESIEIIYNYYNTTLNSIRPSQIRMISPEFLSSIPLAQSFDYTDVLFGPMIITGNNNDNSIITLFRCGCFTVASLGDVESSYIADFLMQNNIFNKEVDVLILAHHGANNGFTTNEFIQLVRPKAAICGSNYGNQYEHPRPEITKMLYDNGIPIYTTKTGDVIIESMGDDKSNFKVRNLISDSTKVSSSKEFVTKRAEYCFSPMKRHLYRYY